MASEDEHEDALPVRRMGKGNAILTYQTVAELQSEVKEVSVKVDFLLEASRGGRGDHSALEARLRAAEVEIVSIRSALQKGQSMWALMLPTILSTASLLVAILSLIRVWSLKG